MTKNMLAIAVTMCACSSDRSKLQDRVRSYCSDLESELTRATQEYERTSPELTAGSGAHESRDVAEAVLATESIGASEGVRRARVHDLKGRFEFCALAHQIDDARFSDFQVRGEKIASELVASSVVADPARTVQLLQQFSALVHELDAIPYLD